MGFSAGLARSQPLPCLAAAAASGFSAADRASVGDLTNRAGNLTDRVATLTDAQDTLTASVATVRANQATITASLARIQTMVDNGRASVCVYHLFFSLL
jgi:hypothetical protein